MKRTIVAVSAAVLFWVGGCKSRPQTAGPAASEPNAGTSRFSQSTASRTGFGFYLLNLSWSPEFCHGHRDGAECAAHAAFVLHGLWPENADGTYPENCSSAPGPADPARYKDIYPEAGLLQHEWKTHGTCSGLSADEFFSDARSAFRAVAIPPALSGITSQTSLPPRQIISLFAASNPGMAESSLLVSCGNNYLTAVEVCLDKSLHPMSCPAAIRSCRAQTVRVPAP